MITSEWQDRLWPSQSLAGGAPPVPLIVSDYDREKLQERLAKLSGGVAVSKVGARPRWR